LKLITKVLREGISFKLVFSSIALRFRVLVFLAAGASSSIAQRETMNDNNFQTQTDRKSELN
jgi:hypothetical protein